MSLEELLQTLSAFDPEAIFPFIDTPYAKYSTSNYVASGSDVPAIYDIVSRHREQLAALDAILQQFYEQRERIACSMKTHEGFVSCIRRIPSDILSEIFIQCLPDEQYLTPDARAAPLLLTQICRCWRGVALGTPRLWCSLAINDTRRKPEQQLSIYQHWLGNSSGCPLSLSINLSNVFHWGGRQWQKPAVVFSCPYTKRCTDLDIAFESVDALYLLLGNVPDLESLYLDGPLGTMERSLSIVQPHPRLLELIIHSPTLEKDTLSLFNPGWTNLTHLGVLFDEDDAINHNIFLTLLQICPNLEHLLFSEILARKVAGPVSLTHAKLHTLEISRMYGEGLFYDTLTLPNLRHLRLYESNESFCQHPPNGSGDRALSLTSKGDVNEFDGDVDEFDVYALFNVFQPGWTDLTSITLDIPSSADIGFWPLQICPNLENMVVLFGQARELPHASLTHHKLRSLTISLGKGYIGRLLDELTLPNLRELDLVMKSYWVHDTFKDFIFRSNCQLETLKIKGAGMSGEQRTQLASLIPTLKLLELHDTRLVADELVNLPDVA